MSKETGTIWIPTNDEKDKNYGLKESNKDGKKTVYARYSFTVGQRILDKDTGETKWKNIRYQVVLFGELAKKMAAILKATKGKKGVLMELSGDKEDPEVWTDRDGKLRTTEKMRVISFRLPGSKEWFTTKDHKLITREFN